MEIEPVDRLDDHATGETPEDVAILYSWANLEGAKYRDFSANRREYRAQMRHRAAEQLRLMELRAQSEAEAAAAEAEAEAAAAHAEADAASVKLAASRTTQTAASVTEEEEQVEHMRKSSLREAAQQARRAAAERLEAARRAEAAALADSIARREEREIAEAQASAVRQAAQYAEAEMRSRQRKTSQPENAVPGRISDPYGPQVVAEGEYFERPGTPVAELEASRFRQQREYIEQSTGVELPPFRMPETVPDSVASLNAIRRPRGYRPDEPSGQMSAAAADESLTGHAPIEAPADFGPRRQAKAVYEERHLSIARDAHRLDEAGALQLRREQVQSNSDALSNPGPHGRVAVPSVPYKEFRRANGNGMSASMPEVVSQLSEDASEQESGTWRAAESMIGTGHSQLRDALRGSGEAESGQWTGDAGGRIGTDGNGNGSDPHPVRDSWGVAWERLDARHDLGADQKRVDEAVADVKPVWSNRPDALRQDSGSPLVPGQPAVDASGPAWLYPKPQLPRFVDSLVDSAIKRRGQLAAQSLRVGSGLTQSQPAREAAAQGYSQPRNDTADNTLQRSREEVASRWFALKGVFAKSDRNQTNEAHATSEKRNTPFVVVYSLAGGVGKTSLVATLGRALSSMGENVLLTDTTSQGLLPFYFGASELHAGVVRTFSPPSGSADAPIHMVSYDCAARQKEGGKTEAETQGEIFDDLLANSHRAHRVLVDLNVNCGWMAGRLGWVKPTILVPLAADMNSVISLRNVEKSFSALKDDEGKLLQPVYLLNQFDASLPLHLDVREVLKQQLGDRLLPFVIRRAVGVSEALAEGMTIVDYDPDSEAAKDYIGVANWLRNVSAPAAAGVRNLRWSER